MSRFKEEGLKDYGAIQKWRHAILPVAKLELTSNDYIAGNGSFISGLVDFKY